MTHTLDEQVAKEIDHAAENRFHQYFKRRHEAPYLPFPLESMLKFDLQLRIGFVEMAKLLPNLDSLGPYLVEPRAVRRAWRSRLSRNLTFQ